MEQYNKSSPPTPASPRNRHIHSSFPHYFYSTPAAPPSSGSITAFVTLCESRRIAAADDDFAFGSSNRHKSLENAVPPVAFADDLFRGGKLLPAVAPKATEATPEQPLKPPPRLQYIANIRKSLRNLRRSSRRGGGGGGGGPKAADNLRRDADPFAAAANKVAKEDAPWCQLPWRRKSKAREEAKADDEEIDGAVTTTTTRKNGKGSWIFRLLRSALKGKESCSSINSDHSKEEDGKNAQLVGLVRSTTVSRYRNSLFHCFGFK